MSSQRKRMPKTRGDMAISWLMPGFCPEATQVDLPGMTQCDLLAQVFFTKHKEQEKLLGFTRE